MHQAGAHSIHEFRYDLRQLLGYRFCIAHDIIKAAPASGQPSMLEVNLATESRFLLKQGPPVQIRHGAVGFGHVELNTKTETCSCNQHCKGNTVKAATFRARKPKWRAMSLFVRLKSVMFLQMHRNVISVICTTASAHPQGQSVFSGR